MLLCLRAAQAWQMSLLMLEVGHSGKTQNRTILDVVPSEYQTFLDAPASHAFKLSVSESVSQ